MNNKILISFIKNKIDIENFSEIKNKNIYEIWEKIIEDYNIWLSNFKDTKLKKNEKKITEILKWRGMSLWWINSLCRKDTELNNLWINRIFVLYLIKKAKTLNIFFEIKTDDKLLISSIKKNFSLDSIKLIKIFNIKYFFKNNFIFFINLKNSIFFLFKSLFKLLLLKKFKNYQIKKFKNKKFVWFVSYYPLNWINLDKNTFYDRHLHELPNFIYSKENNVGYLLYLNKFSFKNLFKNSRNYLEKIFKINYVFVESHIKFYDIIEIFVSSYSCLAKLFVHKKNLQKYFTINDLDVFEILNYEFQKSFWYDNQYNMLHGVAQENFIQDLGIAQKIVTYDELWTQSRSGYYLCKKLDKNNKFIALQHSLSSKNYGAAYNKPSEFEKNNNFDGINTCPAPDIYLTQGAQYQKILSSFYPKEKIKVVGSIKSKVYQNAKNKNQLNKKKIIENLGIDNKKIALIPLSSRDNDYLLDLVNIIAKKKDWFFLITPHANSNLKKIYNKLKLFDNVLIVLKYKTWELIGLSKLVICGYSNLAYEVSFFKVKSIIYIPLGIAPTIPLDDKNSYKDVDSLCLEKL